MKPTGLLLGLHGTLRDCGSQPLDPCVYATSHPNDESSQRPPVASCQRSVQPSSIITTTTPQPAWLQASQSCCLVVDRHRKGGAGQTNLLLPLSTRQQCVITGCNASPRLSTEHRAHQTQTTVLNRLFMIDKLIQDYCQSHVEPALAAAFFEKAFNTTTTTILL